MYACHNYGLIQKSHDYTILSEGLDWYLVRIRGKVIYTPKWVFEDED